MMVSSGAASHGSCERKTHQLAECLLAALARATRYFKLFDERSSVRLRLIVLLGSQFGLPEAFTSILSRCPAVLQVYVARVWQRP